MGWLGWTLTVVGLLIGLVSLMTLVGVFLPQNHTLSRTMILRQPPEAVWAAIRDGQNWPQWWTIIDRVERQPAEGGKEAWRIFYKDGNKFRLRIDEDVAPTKLVQRIDDEAAIFGGTWTYELRPAGGGTAITLTENGELYKPLIRTMAKLTMNPAMYVEGNLKGLAGKFGETADIK